MSVLSDKLDTVFSKSTLRRYLKLMGYSYKRLRFIPAKKPDQGLYKMKKSLIQKYDLLSEQGKIDLFFFDESGFSINSNIPYTWSPINNTMEPLANLKTNSSKNQHRFQNLS